jgi:uncharacterized protein YecE (DUF72 family)
VEINNTFYHLPKAQTMVNWHDKVPAHFLFAVKASRYITHIKKLHDTVEEVKRFFELADLLKRRLGPVLYQLPPSLHKNLERLDEFILSLPKRNHAVFEFRHDWAGWLRSVAGRVRAIYAYFNNDISGHALNNARTLKKILGVG